MKKEETLRMLDQIVTTHKAYLTALQQSEGDSIRFCKCDDVHVYEGIEYLADAAGAVCICTDRKDDTYPLEYFFIYKGVKFFQITEQELSLEVHLDED